MKKEMNPTIHTMQCLYLYKESEHQTLSCTTNNSTVKYKKKTEENET